MTGKNRYVLIYNYLLTKIHYGFYPKGTHLPSIHKLSHLFGVSTMAVRGAFNLLRENGYLSYGGDGRSVVLRDSEQQGFPGQILIQGNEMKDIYQSFNLIFPSIFFYGLSLCGKRDIEELRKILDCPEAAEDESVMEFLAYVTKRLNDPLLLDFYYDVLLFCYPTYLDYLAKDPKRWSHHQNVLYEKLLELLLLKESGNNSALWDMVNRPYPSFEPWPSSTDTKERSHLYQWGGPQIGLSTASEIVSRIYGGDYPVDTFLPSARILSKELSIALITMRRSIILLNDLGVAESINGKGTKVISPKQGLTKVQWNAPATRKNIMLYLESLYIQTITCRQLANSLFPLISPEEKNKLRDKIRFIHAGQTITFCLNSLILASKLSSLKAIYDKLFGFLIWGQPLSYLEPYLQLDRQTDLLAAALEGNDALQFGRALEEAYLATFQSSQKKAIAVGIEEAKRLVLPLFEV